MDNHKDTRLIPLTQGKFAIVDAADYEWLMRWKWHFNYKGYAARSEYVGVKHGKQIVKTERMHRIIANPPSHLSVDHIDGNRLNNSRNNLRWATSSQNKCNSQKKRKGKYSSKFKGVSWRDNKWRARFSQNNKTVHLGDFESEIDAAKAYNEAVKQHHGEFALLNEI